jgi:hypothetical protein
MRQHIGGDGAWATLAQCGAFDALASEAQHAWAQGCQQDGSVGRGDCEFGPGGELVAHHMRSLTCQQGLQAVDEIARKRKRSIPGNPHAIFSLLFRRRPDAERKAPSQGSLGGHGQLR